MDRLTLRIENRSDAAGDMPDDISVVGKNVSIGRKMDNDWSLPDTTRFISGRHVRVLFEGGGYLLEDLSTNGTFLNGSTTRVDGKRPLKDGDTIRIGSYIVTVEITAEPDTTFSQITGAQGVQAPPTAAPNRTTTTGIQRNAATTSAGRGAQTPDFSRFQSGATGAPGVQRPTGGISMPPMANSTPPATQIPDDFDDDLLGLTGAAPDPKPTPPVTAPQVSTPPRAPQVSVPPVARPQVSAPPAPQPQAPPPAPPAPDPQPAPPPAAAAPAPQPAQPDATPAFEVTPVPQSGPAPTPAVETPTPEAPTGPFSPADPTAAPLVLPDAVQPPPQPVVEKTDMTPRGLGERFAETAAPRPVADVAQDAAPQPAPAPAPEPTPAPEPAPAAAAPTPPAPAPPATNDLLEGFLEGAGIADADQLGFDLHDLGVMLGKCARMGTQEMMQMLQDRSAVKLFVANDDRTMRIASGNNPMKFMVDPDEAFTALFVQPRDGYQTGPDGFDNALTDIRQHQAAMMAAIQPALADMLEGLAPKDIANDAGGGRLGSGARKAWEEYEKRWDARAAQGENGMLDAFIDAFSRRYTQALDAL
ncbi:MAG: type VI secretion system-associated FHA domain protein TagH [Pseudomonadota bacterium]